MPALQSSLPTVDEIKQVVPSAIAGLGVKELYLFGSAAQGTMTPESDVDFIYLFDSKEHRADRVRELRHRLRDALARDVDLVNKDYFTTPIQNDPLAELEREMFADHVASSPMIRLA